MSEREIDNMTDFYAKIIIFEGKNIDYNELTKAFPLIAFMAPGGHRECDEEISEYFFTYVRRVLARKEVLATNIDTKYLKKNFRKKIEVHPIELNPYKSNILGKMSFLTKEMENGKFLGYLLKTKDGHKILFMPHKNLILSDYPEGKEPIVDDDAGLAELFDRGIIVYR